MYSVLLVALVALPFAVRKAAASWRENAVARQQWADARVQAHRLADLRTDLRAFASYEDATRDLMQQADRDGLTPSDWEERQVDVQRRELSRHEVAGFLSGAGRGAGYFFIPQRFDLRTVQKGNDLFYFRKGDIDRLRLTLKGVYLAQGQK